MIQRIQSVWLFLSAVFAGLSFRFPFYSGNTSILDNQGLVNGLTASSHILLLFFTAVLVAGCVVIIFLFRNRKLQLRLTIGAILLSIINLVIYFTQIKKYVSGTISITAIFSFVIPLLLLLAARGIWKDEKLVKSLDRLR